MAIARGDEFVRFSHSPEETRGLGRALAAGLRTGDLICLFGDLGAGKTTFVQGLAEGFGSSEPATSPSFTLIHEYRGRLLLYHLDLYRLGPDDLLEAGVEEALGAGGVAVVEWAERLPSSLKNGALEITFTMVAGEEQSRTLTFRPRGAAGARLLRALQDHLDAYTCA